MSRHFISYNKGDLNELENMRMGNDEDHHAYDCHDWYTTLIGVKFGISSTKNHEHRKVVIIEINKRFKGRSHRK